MSVLLLFGLAAAALVINSLSEITSLSGRFSKTSIKLERIRNALADFVTTNGYLPCPANQFTGFANPNSPNTICNTPDGVVPWLTLGLSEEDALDAWARKISYRVYAGNTGLTQIGGASMVNCDTQIPGGAPAIPVNGLCAADHSNLSSQFAAGKGLTFIKDGVPSPQIAFVLISHGPTGYGAWLPGSEGNRMQPPDAGNSAESANSGGGNIFYQEQVSTTGVSPSAANHFDDILLAVGIDELIKRSGLVARDWPDDEIEITAATTTDMTTTSGNRFNVTTAAGGQTLSTTTTVTASGDTVQTLVFASEGATSYYSNCLWWPQSLITYNGVDKFAYNLFLEFSTADGSRSGGAYNDLGGMVVGFLPWKNSSGVFTTIDTSLCGRSNVSTYLGWENNGGLGNLPDPRFGVQFDAYGHAATNDPTPNHLSLVYSGVTHDGVSAAACSAVADTYSGTTCYTSPATSWLRDGLASFHKIRVKVSPLDASCVSAPKISVWLFPYSVCTNPANADICNEMSDLDVDFPTTALPTGSVALSGCIDTPSPADAFDKLFFGMTFGNRDTGFAGSGMYIRSLAVKNMLLP